MLLLFYGVGFVVLALSVGVGMAITRVLTARLRSDLEIRPVATDVIPTDVLQIMRTSGQLLESLGFTFAGALTESDRIAAVDEPAYSILYLDSDRRTLARVSLADSPTRRQPVELSLLSLAEGGQLIETVAWRAHRVSPGLPGHRLVDARTVCPENQYAVHRTRIGAQAEPVHAWELGTIADRLGAFAKRARRHEIQSGHYVVREDGTLRFSLRFALATVIRANRGESARLRGLTDEAAKDVPADSSSEDTTHEQARLRAASALAPDLVFHRRREAIDDQRSMGFSTKVILLATSVLLFALVFGVQLSIETLGWLILALFIHEMGHLTAMWLLGYRDLQILFIPLLGAVASGKKDNVAPWQEAIVLLAGPTPGIILGTFILTRSWVPEGGALQEGAAIMILLNYVNLLPIVPLDGGRLMSVVFFDRFPMAQWIFGGLGAATALAIGLALRDPLIICLGTGLVLFLPRQLIQARTIARVKHRLDGARAPRAEEFALRSVYGELQSRDFDRWNSEVKFQFVRHVMERLHRRRGTAPIAFASLVLYVAIAVIPVGYLRYGPRPLVPSEEVSVPAPETTRPIGLEQGKIVRGVPR